MVCMISNEGLAAWKDIGVGPRFVVLCIHQGALALHYIGSQRQGYSEFLDQFDDEKCLVACFAFEDLAMLTPEDDDPPPSYKGLLVTWTGSRASDADKAALPGAERALHAASSPATPIAFHLHATSKDDLDYCTVIDKVVPAETQQQVNWGEEDDEEEEDEWEGDAWEEGNEGALQ